MSTDVTARTEAGVPKKPAPSGACWPGRWTFCGRSWAELGKVTWPTRDELVKATRMILILSVVLGLLIGWMDLVLQKILVEGVAALAR